MLIAKNPAKNKKVINISADDSKSQLYFLVYSHKWHFLKFRNSRKNSLKNETGLSSVSNQNPTSLDSFQRLRTEKPSKIKASSHSVYSLEPENLSNAIGLRKKQDTPKVVYFTLETSRLGRSQ